MSLTTKLYKAKRIALFFRLFWEEQIEHVLIVLHKMNFDVVFDEILEILHVFLVFLG